MRLFLASQDFGNYVDKLHEMVGGNRRMLFVYNARDDAYIGQEESRKEKVEGKHKARIEKAGFEFKELDLRKFFGKEKELEKFIQKFDPGVIYVNGGNNFVISRAFVQSGFGKILRQNLKEDRYVYMGDSAGAIIMSEDLRYYARGNEDVVPEGYGSKVVWDGVGIISKYILPHIGNPGRGKINQERKELFAKNNKEVIELKDSDVYVINGNKEEVLR